MSGGMRALRVAAAVLLGLALASLPFLHYRLGAPHGKVGGAPRHAPHTHEAFED